jgi:excisionase family DNA binding protein
MMDPILTLPEVVVLLKVAQKTVYTMVQVCRIPTFKDRGQWQFRKYDIDRWIDEQKVVMKGNIRKGNSGV